MSQARPAVSTELTWSGDLVFTAVNAGNSLVIDGDSAAGPSPVQLLVVGLAGCMAMDVVAIIRKGRHPLSACRCRLTGERAPDHPRRLVKVQLHFELRGDLAPEVVERAVALSRDRYCSVWHSMRQDIELETTFRIEP